MKRPNYALLARVICVIMVTGTFTLLKGQDSIVEEIAVFPGGQDAFYAWLTKNLTYPADAREGGVQGTVYVGFIVEKDGSLSDIHIAKGLFPSCDSIVLQTLRKSPPWNPATQKGKAVRSEYRLPVRFALEGKSTEKHSKRWLRRKEHPDS